MLTDSLNLVDLIRRNLSGDVVQKISSSLGESRDRTQAGINAGIPGILSGLEATAGTSDGIQRLSAAVDDADEGIVSRIGGMFGMGSSSEAGLFNLRSILGGSTVSDLSANIGRSSGLASKSVMTLLGFLTPVVLGVLKNIKFTKGLDSVGLASLLSSQRANFAEAMPAANTYRVPETDVRGRPVETYATRETERPRGSGLGWVVALLFLVGLAALLWRWNARAPVHAGNENATDTSRFPATANKAPGTSTSFNDLKTKYQSVFDVAKAQNVDITDSNFENGKLNLKGNAPSSEAANRVWDEIKRINPSMDDISADIAVNTSSYSSSGNAGGMPGQTAENPPVTENNAEVNPRAGTEPQTAPIEKPSASESQQGVNPQAPENNMQENPKAAPEQEAAPMEKPSDSDSDKAVNRQAPENKMQENPKAAPQQEVAPIEKPSEKPSASATEGQTYTVKRGDTLFKISQKFYGNGKDFQRIFDANSDKLKSINSIEVGQELTIPAR